MLLRVDYNVATANCGLGLMQVRDGWLESESLNCSAMQI
jgi:hypothetical protein